MVCEYQDGCALFQRHHKAYEFRVCNSDELKQLCEIWHNYKRLELEGIDFHESDKEKNKGAEK